MDKEVLKQYIDACAIVKEAEAGIKKLEEQENDIVKDSVRGSNPDFPYNAQTFRIEGFDEKSRGKFEERYAILNEKKKKAEAIKLEVEKWMSTIPMRMQRIIKYRIFDGLQWNEVAYKIGRNSSGDQIRMEYDRFFKKN